MKIQKVFLSIFLLLTLGSGLILPKQFARAEDTIPPCPPEVQGKVVSLDSENHSVILEQEDGSQCTASLAGGDIQPISALLSYYFGVSLQEINDYHNQGIGYGVLVKLYSLSNASSTSVADLIAQFKGGSGMGQLYKEYGGKPETVGVGQAKQKVKQTTQPTHTPPGQSNPHKPKDHGLSNAANHNKSHNPKFNPTPTPIAP